MVVAAEVGVRFSVEANQFLRGLVSAKVRGVLDQGEGCGVVAHMAFHVGVRGCELFRVVPPWPGAPRRRWLGSLVE